MESDKAAENCKDLAKTEGFRDAAKGEIVMVKLGKNNYCDIA